MSRLDELMGYGGGASRLDELMGYSPQKETEEPSDTGGFLETVTDFGRAVAGGIAKLGGEATAAASDVLTSRDNMSLKGVLAREMAGNPELAAAVDLSKIEDPGARMRRQSGEVTADILAGQSPEARAASQAVAEAEGFLGTLEAYRDNPRAILTDVGMSLPSMLPSTIGVKVVAAKMLVENGLKAGTRAAAEFLARPDIAAKLLTIGSLGEGGVAGLSIYNESVADGASKTDAALYGTLGGAGTAAIGRVAGKFMGDPETTLGQVLAGGGTGAESLLQAGKNVVRAALSEGVLQELSQSAQEQVMQNLATGRPWDEGVPEASASGLVTGAALGGTVQTGSETLSGMRTKAPRTGDQSVDSFLDQMDVESEVLSKELELTTAQRNQRIIDQQFGDFTGPMPLVDHPPAPAQTPTSRNQGIIDQVMAGRFEQAYTPEEAKQNALDEAFTLAEQQAARGRSLEENVALLQNKFSGGDLGPVQQPAPVADPPIAPVDVSPTRAEQMAEDLGFKRAQQDDVARLNQSLTGYFADSKWEQAYVPDTLQQDDGEIAQVLETIFGRRVVPVRPTGPDVDIFDGVRIPSNSDAVYVNTQGRVDFVNVAGHELFHDLVKRRPDLYDWYTENVSGYLTGLPAYQKKLNGLLQPGEKAYDATAAREELLADFNGDALADPKFLKQLADSDPGRFKKFMQSVITWLSTVGNKLRRTNNSEKYVSDVDAMRGYLKDVLVAYNGGKPIESVNRPQFSPAWHGSPHDFEKFDSNAIGTGEGAQGYGHGLYFADDKRTAEGYKNVLGDKTLSLGGKTYSPTSLEARFGKPLATAQNAGEFEQRKREVTDRAWRHYQQQQQAESPEAGEAYAAWQALRSAEFGNAKETSAGKLYQVELAPAEDEYLDWDKPLSQQSTKVQEAFGIRPGETRKGHADGTGEEVYRGLVEQRNGDDRAASQYLRDQGIRGIKYKDAQSRAGVNRNIPPLFSMKLSTPKKSTYNRVIFDDNDVEVKAKFSRRKDYYGEYDKETGKPLFLEDRAANEKLNGLYDEAESLMPEFKKLYDELASRIPGSYPAVAPLKGRMRSVEKIVEDYKGDPGQIKDLLRGTLVIPDLESGQAAADAVNEIFETVGKPRLSLVTGRTKDGYVDLKFNVKMGNQLGEVQVNVSSMIVAKELFGHGFYEEYRVLPDSVENTPRKAGLVAAQKAIYGRARELVGAPLKSVEQRLRALSSGQERKVNRQYGFSITSKNSTLETKAPFLKADADLNGRGGSVSYAQAKNISVSTTTGTPSTSYNTNRLDSEYSAGNESIDGASGDIGNSSRRIVAQAELDKVKFARSGRGDEHTMGVTRGARAKGRATVTDAEMKVIADAAVKLGVSRRAIEERVRATKRLYPTNDGWAALVLDKVGLDKKGNIDPTWKTVVYSFENMAEDVLSDRLVAEYRRLQKRADEGDRAAQVALRQVDWYANMRDRLREEYGSAGDLFADLLGATSPNTAVQLNWRFAREALGLALSGQYDGIIDKIVAWDNEVSRRETEAARYLEDQRAEGRKVTDIKKDEAYKDLTKALPLPADATPMRTNAKGEPSRYGMNSQHVARALSDLWRVVTTSSAPKARNFSGNLIGYTKEATIDVWAARLLQRLAGEPRVPPPAQTSVKGSHLVGSTKENPRVGAQYGAAQRAFRQAADTLGIDPDGLQAVAWFGEKEVWTQNNWTTSAGEGGSFEQEADQTPTDRFVGMLSAQQSEETQGTDYVPSDADMAALNREIETAAREIEGVVAAKSQSTLGRYGADERSFDVEVVTERGADPTPLWRKINEIGQRYRQQAVGMSRVVQPGEMIDAAVHRPGIEIYFSDPTELSEAGELLTMLNDLGAEFFTFAIDARRNQRTVAGGMGKVVGLRIQYVPEFMESAEDFTDLSDADIADKVDREQVKPLRDLARAARQLDGVSSAQMVYYETSIAFENDYEANARTDGEGLVRAGRGRLWRGRSIYEGLGAPDATLRGPGGAGQSDVGGAVSGVRDERPDFKRSDAAGGGRTAQTGYGVGREGAVQVKGTHYSRDKRETLDSRYYGTGLRGAERAQLGRDSADPAVRNRIYFYVDEGAGVNKESGVGAYPHAVTLNNLYDWRADERGFWDEASAQYNNLDDMTNYVEAAVAKAGFDGVYAPAAFGNQGVAVLLGEHSVPIDEPQFSRKKDLDTIIKGVTPGARDEIEYWTESEDTTPEQAFEDALEQIEDGVGRGFSRADLTSMRRAAIELGIYREISDDEIASTSVSKGKAFDFRLAGKKYVFDKHIVPPVEDNPEDTADQPDLLDLEDPQFSRSRKYPAGTTPAQEAFLDKIGPSITQTLRQRWDSFTDRLGARIKQGVVDKYAALLEVDKALLGDDVLKGPSIASSGYALARMAESGGGALTAMLRAGRIYYDPQNKVIDVKTGTPGLMEVFARLGNPDEIDRFMGWVAANRASELKAQGRENLFTDADITAGKTLNQGTNAAGEDRGPLFTKVKSAFDLFKNDVLDIATKGGIIDPVWAEAWRNDWYVPFYRIMDDEAVTGPRMGGASLKPKEAFKRLKGGTENLNDLLENTLLNFHHLLSQSLKNIATQQALENAETLGIAAEVPEATRNKKASTHVFQGGRKVWYNIDDPLVFNSLTMITTSGMNGAAMRVMRGFKRLFTNFVTASPQFIARNLIRDALHSIAVAPEMSTNVPKNVVKGIADYGFGDKMTEVRSHMLSTGAAFSFGHIYGEHIDDLKYQIGRQKRSTVRVRTPESAVDALLTMGKVARRAWEKYHALSDSAENANRAALYGQVLTTENNKLRAAYESRNLLDFGKHGAWPAVRFLTETVPFLNARLQGLARMGEPFNSPKGRKRFAIVVGAMIMATMALRYSNDDDDEYRRLEDWDKDGSWHIFPGTFGEEGDWHVIIPKPFEVGAIATMAERLFEQAIDDEATGKDFRKSVAHMLLDTFSFNPIPQAGKPIFDVIANKDSFTGRDIETMGMERLSPVLRKRGSTTSVAAGISEAMDKTVGKVTQKAVLSPVQVDYLIRNYLGWVGSASVGMLSGIYDGWDGKQKPKKYLTEYQPLRSFYRDEGRPGFTKHMTEFYELYREANTVAADRRRFELYGDQEKLAELMADPDKVSRLSLQKILSKTNRKLSAINKEIDVLTMNRDVDAEEKRLRIDELRKIKNVMAEQIMAAAKEQLRAKK